MGGRRVGFGGGFKLLPGAEEARSNEAELEVEDFFYFFFLGARWRRKCLGFGLGLARGRGGVFPRGFGVVERGWGWWAARNRRADPDVSRSVCLGPTCHRRHKDSAVTSRHVGP